MVNAGAMRHERKRARDAVVLYHHPWLPPRVLARELTAAAFEGTQELEEEGPPRAWGGPRTGLG